MRGQAAYLFLTRYKWPILLVLWILLGFWIKELFFDSSTTHAVDLTDLSHLYFFNLVNGALLFVGGPGQLLTFLFATFHNPLVVGLTAALGTTMGEIVGYAIGRTGIRPDAQLAGMIEKLQNTSGYAWARKHSFISLMALSMIPNPAFDPASILAGLARMKFISYITPVFLGKSTRFLAIALTGAYVGSLESNFLVSIMTTFSHPAFFVFYTSLVLAGISFTFQLFLDSRGKPPPMLLLLAIWACVGQLGLLVNAELFPDNSSWLPITFAALLLATFLDIWVFKQQKKITVRHYKSLLTKNKLPSGVDTDQAKNLAELGLVITGVDFFPGFYKWLTSGDSPRLRRAREYHDIVTQMGFDIDGVSSAGVEEHMRELERRKAEKEHMLAEVQETIQQNPNTLTAVWNTRRRTRIKRAIGRIDRKLKKTTDDIDKVVEKIYSIPKSKRSWSWRAYASLSLFVFLAHLLTVILIALSAPTS